MLIIPIIYISLLAIALKHQKSFDEIVSNDQGMIWKFRLILLHPITDIETLFTYIYAV